MIPSVRARLRTPALAPSLAPSLVLVRSASRLSAIHRGLRASGVKSSPPAKRSRNSSEPRRDGKGLLSSDDFRAQMSGGGGRGGDRGGDRSGDRGKDRGSDRHDGFGGRSGGGGGVGGSGGSFGGSGGRFGSISSSSSDARPKTFTDKKGKWLGHEPLPQSRSGRFHSPDHSHGKESLSYHVQHNQEAMWGAVRELIDEKKAAKATKATESRTEQSRTESRTESRTVQSRKEQSRTVGREVVSSREASARQASTRDTRRAPELARDGPLQRQDSRPARPGDKAGVRDEESDDYLPSRWPESDKESRPARRGDRAGVRGQKDDDYLPSRWPENDRASRPSRRDDDDDDLQFERRPSRRGEDRHDAYEDDYKSARRPSRRDEEDDGNYRSERRPSRRDEEEDGDDYRSVRRPSRRDDDDAGPRSSEKRSLPRDHNNYDSYRSDDGPGRSSSRRSRDDTPVHPFAETNLRPSRTMEYFKDSRPSRWREYGSDGGATSSIGTYANEELNSKAYRDTFPVSLEYTTATSQFIYGRSAVNAALWINRRKLHKLYVLEGQNRLPQQQDRRIIRECEKRGIPVRTIDDQRVMNKMSQGRPHNGLVMEASPLPVPPVVALSTVVGKQAENKPGFKDVDDKDKTHGFYVILGHQSHEDRATNGVDPFVPTATRPPSGYRRPRNPLVLVLDNVVDPGNLGALLRSAAFLGVSAVCMTAEGSAAIGPTAIKAAAGAAEEIRLFTISQPLTQFIKTSRGQGWRVYAAVAPPSGSTLRRTRGTGAFMTPETIDAQAPLYDAPCMLVLGNEGLGLSNEVKAHADVQVYIPHGSRALTLVDSLNVSVAGALLASSFLKYNKARAEEGMAEMAKGPTGKVSAGGAVDGDGEDGEEGEEGEDVEDVEETSEPEPEPELEPETEEPDTLQRAGDFVVEETDDLPLARAPPPPRPSSSSNGARSKKRPDTTLF